MSEEPKPNICLFQFRRPVPPMDMPDPSTFDRPKARPGECIGEMCTLFTAEQKCLIAIALAPLSEEERGLVADALHGELEAMIDGRIEAAFRQYLHATR